MNINIFKSSQKIIDVIDIIGAISYTSTNNINTICDAQEIIKQCRFILEDTHNQHLVIFRINSPGGTAAAGEEIANMINKLRNKNIITIASIGDIGCSAAYLIASQCNYIFANKMSLLGSIGVIMPIPNIKDLSDKLGIKINYLKSGKMKDIGNAFRDMTQEEKDYIESLLVHSHNIFIDMVKHYRKVENADLFDGRFVTAKIALENNLIDNYNDFDNTIEYALKLLKTTRRGVKIKIHQKKTSLLSKLFHMNASSLINFFSTNLFSTNNIKGMI